MRNGNRWNGDTEIYFFNQKDKIISLIKKSLRNLETQFPDYKKELDQIVIPKNHPINMSRNKGVFTQPVPVIGIDKDTNEIIYELDSYTEAENLGFRNISQIVSGKNGRTHSKGIRWFKKSEFDPNSIPHLPPPNYGKPIKCIETNQFFLSTIHASKVMRIKGYKVNSSHITSVLKGIRKHTQGFTWKYINISSQDVINQDPNEILDYIPPKNSNSEIITNLQSISDPTVIKSFKSQSAAARFLGVSPASILKAKRINSELCGYKIVLNK